LRSAKKKREREKLVSAEPRGDGTNGTSPLLPERSEGKEGWLVSAEPRRDGVVIS